jgi:hypothetical protein
MSLNAPTVCSAVAPPAGPNHDGEAVVEQLPQDNAPASADAKAQVTIEDVEGDAAKPDGVADDASPASAVGDAEPASAADNAEPDNIELRIPTNACKAAAGKRKTGRARAGRMWRAFAMPRALAAMINPAYLSAATVADKAKGADAKKPAGVNAKGAPTIYTVREDNPAALALMTATWTASVVRWWAMPGRQESLAERSISLLRIYMPVILEGLALFATPAAGPGHRAGVRALSRMLLSTKAATPIACMMALGMSKVAANARFNAASQAGRDACRRAFTLRSEARDAYTTAFERASRVKASKADIAKRRADAIAPML